MAAGMGIFLIGVNDGSQFYASQRFASGRHRAPGAVRSTAGRTARLQRSHCKVLAQPAGRLFSAISRLAQWFCVVHVRNGVAGRAGLAAAASCALTSIK
jgi:hypothetical protein